MRSPDGAKEEEMAGRTGIGGVSDALFAELERLQVADSSDADALNLEISRAKAVREISATIIDNNKLVLDIAKAKAQMDGKELLIPKGLLS